MPAEFLTWAILALRPDWQPEACDRDFAADAARERCVAERDEGAAWAAELAGHVKTEAERQELDPLLMVAVGYRESHFNGGDVCRIEIAAERIVSRAAREDGGETITMTFRADPTRTATVDVTVLAERADGTLEVDRCSAGEIGLFQLVATEARAGQVVPATGEELPRNARERRQRVLVPQVNVSLAAVALDAARTWQCEVEPTPEAVARCEADPWSWIGAYNTGRRSGTAWERYARYVSRTYEAALQYACGKMPEAAACPADEPEVGAHREPPATDDREPAAGMGGCGEGHGVGRTQRTDPAPPLSLLVMEA